MTNKISWVTRFKASEDPAASIGGKTFTIKSKESISIKGVLIDSTENRNKWMIEKDDFKQVAEDFIGKQIRVDHGDKVTDVKGIVLGTEVDAPHSEAREMWDPPNENPHIHYLAEITSKDDNFLMPIKNGYVAYVSPAVDAGEILCSSCKATMENKFVKECGCDDSGILLKHIVPRELSIVASPAYDKTVMFPFGFKAAMDNVMPRSVKDVGDSLGIDWKKIPFDEFKMGMSVELEHGKIDPQTDITGDDPLKTGKIALAHLKELPDYYTRLSRMENTTFSSEENEESISANEESELTIIEDELSKRNIHQ